jgi:phospholipid/cholesterol/gamma-HCH transport system ATP-binding protein
MKKRAGLARAMVLDPEFLFFDEPSAGLDPLTSKRLDDLILEIRDCFGTTIVIVTHELASIFAVGDRAIYLDANTKTALAMGAPEWLLHHGDGQVRQFLSRGENDG